MSWSGKASLEEAKVVGTDVLVTFRVPVREAIALAVAQLHKAKGKDPIVAIIAEHLELDPAEFEPQALIARARQTSWHQALLERLTGTGPKEA